MGKKMSSFPPKYRCCQSCQKESHSRAQKVDIEEIDFRPTGGEGGGDSNHPEDPDAWLAEMSRARAGAFVCSDSSLLEE